MTLCTLPLLFVVAAWSGALEGRPVNFNGGIELPAGVHAFGEPFVAWGALAYRAFIVHAPMVVGASVALAGWLGGLAPAQVWRGRLGRRHGVIRSGFAAAQIAGLTARTLNRRSTLYIALMPLRPHSKVALQVPAKRSFQIR